MVFRYGSPSDQCKNWGIFFPQYPTSIKQLSRTWISTIIKPYRRGTAPRFSSCCEIDCWQPGSMVSSGPAAALRRSVSGYPGGHSPGRARASSPPTRLLAWVWMAVIFREETLAGGRWIFLHAQNFPVGSTVRNYHLSLEVISSFETSWEMTEW